MSRPSAGNYMICSRILSPTGEKMCITFNGENQFATMEPCDCNNQKQVWMLKDCDANTQFVVPMEATNLQAAYGDQAVTVIQAGGYVWTIRSGDEGYTIQDGACTVNWGVNMGHAGEKVTIMKDEGCPNQRWIFVKQED